MGLKKTEAEKKAAAAQRKKNRQGLVHGWKYLTDAKYYKEEKAKGKLKKESERLKITKDDKTPAAKAGLSVKQRTEAAQRNEKFQAAKKAGTHRKKPMTRAEKTRAERAEMLALWKKKNPGKTPGKYK
tara:strand:+ start:338 stop:721 length:384 start_codon:yes stop_codon:yes gene_type:complete